MSNVMSAIKYLWEDFSEAVIALVATLVICVFSLISGDYQFFIVTAIMFLSYIGWLTYRINKLNNNKIRWNSAPLKKLRKRGGISIEPLLLTSGKVPLVGLILHGVFRRSFVSVDFLDEKIFCLIAKNNDFREIEFLNPETFLKWTVESNIKWLEKGRISDRIRSDYFNNE